MPLTKTSFSIFCVTVKPIACENKNGAILRRTLGFVDLRGNEHIGEKNRNIGIKYLRILSSIPSLLLSNKALNHALNEVTSACDRSERGCATVSVFRKNAEETVRPFLVISLFSNCEDHSF